MSDDGEIPIELQLVQDATIWDFEVTSSEIRPTAGNDNFVVRIEMQIEDEGVEHMSLPVIFTLAMLSFSDARPRGFSSKEFAEEDEFTVADMLRHLTFESGRLRLCLDYVRGRCVKTTIHVDANGKVVLETINRGQAATRWIETLKGKRYVNPVPSQRSG